MDIFHLNLLRHIQIHMGKIPNSLNTAAHQTLRHCFGFRFRDGQHGNVDMVGFHVFFHVFHGPHFPVPYPAPVQQRILVKNPHEKKAPALKIPVIGKCLPQITCPNDNQVMALVQTEYFPDFLKQVFHVITISLLPKAAKIIKVLSDLRCGYFHDIAKFL